MNHHIKIYALSTCIWCKKTIAFLDKHQIVYDKCYVDELKGDKKTQIEDEVKKYNPRKSYPTVVIDDKHIVVGYQETELKKLLELK